MILGDKANYFNGGAVSQNVIWYRSKNDLDTFCLSACVRKESNMRSEARVPFEFMNNWMHNVHIHFLIQMWWKIFGKENYIVIQILENWNNNKFTEEKSYLADNQKKKQITKDEITPESWLAEKL